MYDFYVLLRIAYKRSMYKISKSEDSFTYSISVVHTCLEHTPIPICVVDLQKFTDRCLAIRSLAVKRFADAFV